MGYADPRSGINLSIFRHVARLLNPKGKNEFGLEQEVFGAEPVAYNESVIHERISTDKLVELRMANRQSSQTMEGRHFNTTRTRNRTLVDSYEKFLRYTDGVPNCIKFTRLRAQ